MLIIFLGSDSELLRSYFPNSHTNIDTPVLIAQAGVYELSRIISNFPLAKLFVIKQDLEAAGLVSSVEDNVRVNIIHFEEFVTLTTQHSPCITVQ
jgi:sulfur relay protein TusB/DsrH